MKREAGLLLICLSRTWGWTVLPTIKVEPALAQSLDYRGFVAKTQPLAWIPRVASKELVDELRQDLLALQAAGYGGPAGTVDPSENVRLGVHQIWLDQKSPALCGRLDARNALALVVRGLEHDLHTSFRLNGRVELSYLQYRPGCYYHKHIDTMRDRGGNDESRAVSFILYLGSGEDGDISEWNLDRDGGSLRIHGSENFTWLRGREFVRFSDESFVDLVPQPGSLLLFCSETIPHEVCLTMRSRACVVGWFWKS